MCCVHHMEALTLNTLEKKKKLHFFELQMKNRVKTMVFSLKRLGKVVCMHLPFSL